MTKTRAKARTSDKAKNKDMEKEDTAKGNTMDKINVKSKVRTSDKGKTRGMDKTDTAKDNTMDKIKVRIKDSNNVKANNNLLMILRPHQLVPLMIPAVHLTS